MDPGMTSFSKPFPLVWKNVTVEVSVGLRDLNLEKDVALGNQLAQKAAARIP